MAGKIAENITKMLEDFLPEENLELYYVEFVKEGKERYLRVYIDTPEDDTYIGSDDCEKVSHFLSDKLDEVDLIEGSYILEVSSPGMDRALITDSHFEKYKGSLVDVKLYKAKNGKKELTGTLVSKDDQILHIQTEDNENMDLPLTEVAKVRLAVVF